MTFSATIAHCLIARGSTSSVQWRAPAWRVDHRRTCHIHGAENRRSPGPARWRTGHCCGTHRAGRFLRACAGRETETRFRRFRPRSTEWPGALTSRRPNCAREHPARRAPAFMEAVLSSVTAGVIALDLHNRILLVNRSAEALSTTRRRRSKEGDGRHFARPRRVHARRPVGSECDRGRRRRPAHARGQTRRVPQDGSVLTFDDITDQLTDQRRAAWSDIARRIAHEIKNPLTPIQLAAERLQRRFGRRSAPTRSPLNG